MAMDGDEGSNALISYSIVPNSQVTPLFASDPLFAIDEATGEITVSGTIDFELQSLVRFTVEATDMGSPALTGSAEVSISVRDLNDNLPEFNQTMYGVSVLETVPVGTVVLTTVASDADSNQNGEVMYTLQDNTNTFGIDEATGAIFNARCLDFESDCFYRLLVTASDGGSVVVRNSTALVDVIVLPVHDLPPSFTESSYSRTLPENPPPGTSILQVSASDDDLTSCSERLEEMMLGSGSGDQDSLAFTEEPPTANGNFAIFEYLLLNHNDAFAIDPRTGLITNRVVLDHEDTPLYRLSIQARDPEGLAANVSATVTLLDLNDNLPVFTQSQYTMVVSENSPLGTVILRVTATDRDSIDRGRLCYSLRDQTQFFAIDNRTGEISVAGPIDFDVLGSTISLIALATDTASNSATAFVRLTITDLIDIPPFIGTVPRTLTFTEGQVSLLPFPQINITDMDSSQLLCSATVELESPQQLNTASECQCPDLTLISSCDSGCYEFLQLPSPSSFPGMAVQSEGATTLTLVGNFSLETYITAIQSIQYINLISNPLPEQRTVSIYVFDCVLPSNMLMNVVNIVALNVFPPVVDLNGPSEAGMDFETIFRERGPRVAIASSDAVITDEDMVREREELTRLEVWIANPLDGESESLVVYPPLSHPTITLERISAHNLSFSGTALLSDYATILRQIFYENSADEPIPLPARMVRVMAQEFHLSSDAATTTIRFLSSNDHAPVILTAPPHVNSVTSFREGAAEGVALTASDGGISDMDSSEDNILQLRVHLVSPSEYDLITLSLNVSESLIVTRLSNSSFLISGSAPPADYDTIIRGLAYRFTGDEFESIFPPKFVYLEIEDSKFSTFSAVQISLEPVNDQLPVFERTSYVAEVSEDAPAGESLVQVSATDGDRFSENVIRYGIASGNEDGFFEISSSNGTLYLARGGLDFDATRVHRLVVDVTDLDFDFNSTSSLPPLSTALVTINLRDVNDHVPMLGATEYNATVGEGVPIGTPVLMVLASDRDSDPHSLLEFDLAGTSDFMVDREGLISTSAEIDRERMPLYVFYVNVRNPGISAFDTARITIMVQDLDDSPPVLVLEPDTVTLQEPETEISLAVNLSISDQDPNPSLDYAIVQVLSSDNTSQPLGALFSLVGSDAITVSGNGSSLLVFRGESRALTEYESVLRGILYQDLSDEPVAMSREVAYQVGSNPLPGQPLQLQEGDGEMVSEVAILAVEVGLLNDNAPSLFRDIPPEDAGVCEGVAGSYLVEYVEDGEPVLVSPLSLEVRDRDSGEDVVEYAVVEVLDARDVGLERLSVNLSDSSPLSVSAEESSDFRLVIRGSASLQHYQAALTSIR